MISEHKDEARHWDEAIPAGVSSESIDAIVELIRGKIGNAGIGIEVGCGHGQYTRHLPHVIGADISYNLLHEIEGFPRVVANSEKLPFKSETFDYVYINSLHHMAEKAVVPELIRVLKPGKPIFLLEPNLFHPIRYFCMRNRLLFPEHSPEEKAFNPYRIKELLTESGATVASLRFLSIKMYPRTWRGRLQDVLNVLNTRWTHSWFFIEAVKS